MGRLVKNQQISLAIVIILILSSPWAGAIDLIGRVSTGVLVDDPAAVAARLAAGPGLDPDDSFFVAWTVSLDGAADVGSVEEVRRVGARPWIRAVMVTPVPVMENLDRLETELAELAEIARRVGGDSVLELVWAPVEGAPTPRS